MLSRVDSAFDKQSSQALMQDLVIREVGSVAGCSRGVELGLEGRGTERFPSNMTDVGRSCDQLLLSQ